LNLKAGAQLVWRDRKILRKNESCAIKRLSAHVEPPRRRKKLRSQSRVPAVVYGRKPSHKTWRSKHDLKNLIHHSVQK